MPSVELNGEAMQDQAGFHAECQRALGFPASYSGTMDAWVDSLSYLRDDENMTRFRLKPNEVLEIVVKASAAMHADLRDEMGFCVAGINERYEDYGEKPALKLSLR
jgi:hypothetical protein